MTDPGALNFQHLRYFWAVAHEGNLTRAAERMRVTQSAVSVQVRKLEDAIGRALFDRRGRGLSLTPAGRVALDYADSIFSIGDELLGALADADERARRTVRVGVLATLSRNFQIEFLRPLINREDVRVRVRSGSLDRMVERLDRHELDVVLSNFLPKRDADSDWVAHRLATQPVSLIGHPRPGKVAGVERLLSEEPLVLPPPDSGIRIAFDAFVERLGLRPNVVAEVDDMAMLRLFTREHHGLAVIPPIVVHDELMAGTLTELRQLPDMVETFYALTTSRRRPGKLVRELVHGRTG